MYSSRCLKMYSFLHQLQSSFSNAPNLSLYLRLSLSLPTSATLSYGSVAARMILDSMVRSLCTHDPFVGKVLQEQVIILVKVNQQCLLLATVSTVLYFTGKRLRRTRER